MEGFGVHTSMWTMKWDREGTERAVQAAVDYKMDFLEIALLDAPSVDAAHTRKLLEDNDMRAVCSLGLPEAVWPSRDPESAIAFMKGVFDKANEMGAEAVSGVTYGGIGERTDMPPTEAELSNVARALEPVPATQNHWASGSALSLSTGTKRISSIPVGKPVT